MKKFVTVGIILALLSLAFGEERLETLANKYVSDPNHTISHFDRLQLAVTASLAPVETHLYLYHDLSNDSLKDSRLIATANSKSITYDDYYPAGQVLDEIAKAAAIGEFDRSGKKSIALLATAQRGDKRRRWAVSTSFSIPRERAMKANSEAFMAWGFYIVDHNKSDRRWVNKRNMAKALNLALKSKIWPILK